MKLSRQLMVASIVTVTLSACTVDPSGRRQAKDDFEYLEAPGSKSWVHNAESPVHYYDDYAIPQGEYRGGIGKEVDIRPPQQVLELVPGTRVEHRNGQIIFWHLNEEGVQKLWGSAQGALQNKDITYSNNADELKTDWVSWKFIDENYEFSSKYSIKKVQANRRFGLSFDLTDWQQDGEKAKVSALNKERYTAHFVNTVTLYYDEQERLITEQKALALQNQIPFSMSSDRTGLPVIIARAPYDVMWQRVAPILIEMGFDVEDRNRSQGTLSTKYESVDSSFWEETKLEPVSLPGYSYTVQLGDLKNRTSINITDSKGVPIDPDILEKLVPVFAASAQRTSSIK
ncbi:outer membrane protein assembly factor BamC [Vibrio sp.]|nr:outer membrane protein assembly factor BamC [Vibrio sp.]